VVSGGGGCELAVLPCEGEQLLRHTGECVPVAGYYHNSLVGGPGRRSSVLLAGCDLACPGCRVPSLQPAGAGAPLPVDLMADAPLAPADERDGVSIPGGEPTMQPE
jgi:pyruvate-formate lyase-activating enzyme